MSTEQDQPAVGPGDGQQQGGERRYFVRKVCLIHKLLYALFQWVDEQKEERYIYLVDLSPGGMRFTTERKLEGAAAGPFYLCFSLEGIRTENYFFSGDFFTQARLAWQKPYAGDSWVAGLQFLYVPDEMKALITRLTDEFGETSRSQHVRLKNAVDIRFRPQGSEADWWRGQTHDLSPRGLVAKFGVGSEASPSLEAGARVEVKLPEQHVQFIGEVRWQRPVGEQKREMGLRVLDVPQKDAQVLHEFLKEAAPAAVSDRVLPAS